MRGTRNSSILCLIAVAALASTSGAQNRSRAVAPSSSPDMTPAQRTFAQAYLSAITSPDIERYKRLLHPRTRACMTPANAEFFNTIFARRVGRFARNPHLSVRKLKDAGLINAAKHNGLAYPDRPSHAFEINLISSGPNQYAITAFAVRDNGIWYEVLPCPSAKSLEVMKEAKIRAVADSIKAREVADTLQEPLRGEIVALLKDEGAVSASQRYSAVAQIDLAMARRVIKALEQNELRKEAELNASAEAESSAPVPVDSPPPPPR